jgi:hypothetical protein
MFSVSSSTDQGGGKQRVVTILAYIQPYRDVTEFAEHLEVAAGPAAKIWYRIRWRTLDAS